MSNDGKRPRDGLGLALSVIAWLSVIACLAYLQYLRSS